MKKVKNSKVLGVIPARGGSKGLPGKNLKELAEKPLIAYVIESAKNSKNLDKIIVSTESKEIAEVATKYGAEILIRPEELARDEVSLIPVVRHAMLYLDKKGWKADIIVSLQPTSPLTESKDIDKAINKILETNCNSVVSVSKIEHGHPYRAMKIEQDKLIPLFLEHEKYLQRQDLPIVYAFNGAIFVRKRDLLENWSGKDFALGRDVRAIVMSQEKSINIDTELDFILAEAVLRKKDE